MSVSLLAALLRALYLRLHRPLLFGHFRCLGWILRAWLFNDGRWVRRIDGEFGGRGRGWRRGPPVGRPRLRLDFANQPVGWRRGWLHYASVRWVGCGVGWLYWRLSWGCIGCGVDGGWLGSGDDACWVKVSRMDEGILFCPSLRQQETVERRRKGYKIFDDFHFVILFILKISIFWRNLM